MRDDERKREPKRLWRVGGINNKVVQAIGRRLFLKRLSMVSMLLSTSTVLTSCKRVVLSDEPVLDEKWLTIAAVQERLFPQGSDSPGAKDVNAAAYLRSILERPEVDAEERDFIFKGVGWLNGISQDQHGVLFLALPAVDQDSVLKSIARSRVGESWMSILLLYIFETLLSDPVYGGNPNGSGWQWLEHQPGFPTPTLDKRYFNL